MNKIRRKMFELIKSRVYEDYEFFLTRAMANASNGTEEIIINLEEFEKEINVITISYYKAFFGILPVTHHNTYYPPGHDKRMSHMMFLKYEYSNIPSDTNLHWKITVGSNSMVDYCINYDKFDKYIYHELIPMFFNTKLILSKYRNYSFKLYGIVDSNRINDIVSTYICNLNIQDKQKLFDNIELKEVFYAKRVKLCYNYLKGIGINEKFYSELKNKIPDSLEDSGIFKKPKRIKI